MTEKHIKPLSHKKLFMIYRRCRHKRTKWIVSISIIIAISFCQACSNPSQASPCADNETAPSNRFDAGCIPVEGRVFGDVKPCSVVYVYKTRSLHYDDVMSSPRKPWPISWALVNESGGFDFPCLTRGKYVFVIETSAFDRNIGPPLPFEFERRDVSLRIGFQGWDGQHAVGAFSIENSALKSDSQLAEDDLSN